MPNRGSSPANNSPATAGGARKGLQLKKAPKGNELTEAMKQEAAISGVSVAEVASAAVDNVGPGAGRESVPETLREEYDEWNVCDIDFDKRLNNFGF